MIPFADDLALGIQQKSRIDVIYFDFAKAFDSVNHDIILHKLKYQFNIDGTLLNFLKSYLENRTQRVVISEYYINYKYQHGCHLLNKC